MDPWLSKQGAFDAAWFQYPKNHHMADFVQEKLANSQKDKYIYISHEHLDHFDLPFLQSLKARDFTILLANYAHPVVKRKLNAAQYYCKNIVMLRHEERFPLRDGELFLFVIDAELNCDSAILVRNESHGFLNINDCKIHDQLSDIAQKYGAIDVFTAQFSGASWYPTCYRMSAADYKRACKAKVSSKFAATALAIHSIKPKIYLPSAGPPCFLDPLLLPIHFQKHNSYPRAPQLLRYLDTHEQALNAVTKWPEIWPGDELDVASLQITHHYAKPVEDEDFNSYVRHYAKEYQFFFELREKANQTVHPKAVFKRLYGELLKKIAAMKYVHQSVTSRLYWQIQEYPDEMYCIDLPNKTIERTSSIQDCERYVRITAPAWQVEKVLNQEISWPDFALTFRLNLERVPDVYNTILHGFLILDAEKLGSFCEKMAENYKKNDRIVIDYKGKKYSILRFCPHQGADLSQGHMEGCHYICPRHQWQFDIENGGKCKFHDATIDAILIDKN